MVTSALHASNKETSALCPLSAAVSNRVPPLSARGTLSFAAASTSRRATWPSPNARHNIDGRDTSRVAHIRIGTLLTSNGAMSVKPLLLAISRGVPKSESDARTSAPRSMSSLVSGKYPRIIAKSRGVASPFSVRVHIRSVIQQNHNQLGAILVYGIVQRRETKTGDVPICTRVQKHHHHFRTVVRQSILQRKREKSVTVIRVSCYSQERSGRIEVAVLDGPI
jgi:hypothetical protein